MLLQKSKNKIDIIKKLLTHGANINAIADLEPHWSHSVLTGNRQFEGTVSALMLAAANGNLEYLKLFIEQGADWRYQGSVEGSALEIAQRFKRKAVSAYLGSLK